MLWGAWGESVPKLQSSLLSIFLVQIFHKFRTLVIGWMVLLAARFAGGAQIVLSTWVFFKFRRHVRWNWVIIRIIIWQIFTTYQSVNWQRCPEIVGDVWLVMVTPHWWWFANWRKCSRFHQSQSPATSVLQLFFGQSCCSSGSSDLLELNIGNIDNSQSLHLIALWMDWIGWYELIIIIIIIIIMIR